MLFREDMYSLLFIASLKPQYKQDCEDQAQEAENKMDQILKKNKEYFKE